MSTDEAAERLLTLDRPQIDLYGRRDYFEAGESLLEYVLKKEASPEQASNLPVAFGQKPQPFDMAAATDTIKANIHHSRCIFTSVASHVGLGHKNEATHDKLDELCSTSWYDVLCDLSMDYFVLGNCYLEVRRDGNKIVGLHHVPAKDVYVFVEDEFYRMHYFLKCDGGAGNVRFARFGDLQDFLSQERQDRITQAGGGAANGRVSELIHISMPTVLDRWYGFPQWIAAIVAIEVVQALHQHTFDFFNNSGVPEFMLFLLGKKISEDNWKKIEASLRKHVGLGNRYKSFAINLDDPEMKVQLEKMAMEGRSDATTFGNMSDTLSLEIVSAHGVPPLLAGIQIPGKLGATNELPNALMAFQSLVIGQAQRRFVHSFKTTLGNANKNGGLGLSKGAFEFNTILEEIDLGIMDTVGRMRDPVASGRDPKAGLKD